MVILAIKTALENIDENYCKLSQIDYSMLEVNESTKKLLEVEKYLERPLAYEFYHQLRKLIDSDDVIFDGLVIQAEVDKRYQHCAYFGNIRTLFPVTSGQRFGIIRTAFRHIRTPCRIIK